MASRSLNRVMLIGNLTRDPELKYTPAGTAVCTFSVATNRSWTTQDGHTKDEVQYHRLVAWQKLAELCAKLLSKGKKVYVEGRITYRTFTGKDGQQRSITEIVLDDFIVYSDGKRNATLENRTDDKSKEESTKHEEDAAANVSVSENKDDKNKEQKEDQTVNPDDIPF